MKPVPLPFLGQIMVHIPINRTKKNSPILIPFVIVYKYIWRKEQPSNHIVVILNQFNKKSTVLTRELYPIHTTVLTEKRDKRLVTRLRLMQAIRCLEAEVRKSTHNSLKFKVDQLTK